MLSPTVQSRAAGFTLIEVMVVLAIIGVLSSFAIPALHSYIVRARIGEGLNLATAAKQQVAEVWLSGVASDQGYAGSYQSPSATANIAALSIHSKTGVVTIQTTAAAGAGTMLLVPYVGSRSTPQGLPDATRDFSPSDLGALAWLCLTKASNVPSNLTLPASPTLDSALAPTECR